MKTEKLRERYKTLNEEERYKLASAFVTDAQNARFEHGEASGFLKGAWNHKAFSIYYNSYFQILNYVLATLHLALILLEPPMSHTITLDPASISKSFWVAIAEILLSCFHLFDTSLKMQHMGNHEFFSKGWWNFTTFVARVLILVDAILFLISGCTAFRFSRVLRPLLIITRNRDLRQLCDAVSKTVMDLLEIVTLILFLIFIYGIIGYNLFGEPALKEYDESFYAIFSSMWNSSLSLFVLLSADNFLDLLEPAYKISPWYSLYFMSFIVLGSYLVLPLVLAVVVEAYKENHKSVVQKDRIKERRAVSEAFFLLAGSEDGTITPDVWEKFMKLRDPKLSKNLIKYIFNTIDTDGSGDLDILEFFELCDVLQLEFQEDSTTEQKSATVLFGIFTSASLHHIGQLTIATNAFLWLIQPIFSYGLFQFLDTFCIFVLFSEVILLSLMEGLKRFKHNGWMAFCDAAILAAVAGKMLMVLSSSIESTFLIPVTWTNSLQQICAVLGSFRMIRVVLWSPKLTNKVSALAKLVPFLWTFIVAFGMLFYAYATIGMEFFGKNSTVGEIGSFANIGDSFVTLFCCMISAIWNSIIFDTLKNFGPISILYFLSFYIVVVVIVLNLLLAVLLDAYGMQERSTTQLQVAVEEAKPVPEPTPQPVAQSQDTQTPEAKFMQRFKLARSPSAERALSSQTTPSNDTTNANNRAGGVDSNASEVTGSDGENELLRKIRLGAGLSFGREKIEHQKSFVQVRKRKTNWKHELIREDLPQLKLAELQELNKTSSVNLLQLYKQKQMKKKAGNQMSMLHQVLFGSGNAAEQQEDASEGTSDSS